MRHEQFPTTEPDTWSRSRLIVSILRGVDIEDYEEVCRVLIANRISLRENIDVLDEAIEALRYEQDCCTLAQREATQ